MTVFGSTPDPAEQAPDQPLLDAIPAGSEADRLLRAALETLREHAPDRETATLYTEILQGRRSARDLVDSEGFAAAAEQGTRRHEEYLASLTEQERAELEERAQAIDLTGPAAGPPPRS